MARLRPRDGDRTILTWSGGPTASMWVTDRPMSGWGRRRISVEQDCARHSSSKWLVRSVEVKRPSKLRSSAAAASRRTRVRSKSQGRPPRGLIGSWKRSARSQRIRGLNHLAHGRSSRQAVSTTATAFPDGIEAQGAVLRRGCEQAVAANMVPAISAESRRSRASWPGTRCDPPQSPAPGGCRRRGSRARGRRQG